MNEVDELREQVSNLESHILGLEEMIAALSTRIEAVEYFQGTSNRNMNMTMYSRVKKIAAQHYSVTIDTLSGQRGPKPARWARKAYAYFLHEYMGISQKFIGEHIMSKNSTTINYYCDSARHCTGLERIMMMEFIELASSTMAERMDALKKAVPDPDDVPRKLPVD